MSNPLISVLIASNTEKFLEESLSSIQKQTYDNFEVILVLNGDPHQFDDVLSRVNFFDHLKVVFTLIPGLAHCLNVGLDYAQGELIARLDSDDTWKQDHLASLHQFLELNDLDVASSSADFIDEDGMFISSSVEYMSNKDVRRKLHYKNPIFHPGVLYKKDVVIRAGGYRGFRYAQDWELWLRLASQPSVKFGVSGKNSLNYRISSIQSRGNISAYLDGICYLIRYNSFNIRSVFGLIVRFIYLLIIFIK